jgi:regulator of RNase E activity RraB
MDVVQEMRALLTEMVEAHDGVYDGWATEVVE